MTRSFDRMTMVQPYWGRRKQFYTPGVSPEQPLTVRFSRSEVRKVFLFASLCTNRLTDKPERQAERYFGYFKADLADTYFYVRKSIHPYR